MAGLMILCGALLSSSMQNSGERGSTVDRHRADATADAGISHAVTNLTAGVEDDIGSPAAPIEFGAGSYWVDVQPHGDDAFLVTSTAGVAGAGASIEAVLAPVGGGIYDNAVFAGNSSDDGGYTLEFGGEGGQADEIEGDVYSGGDVLLEGDATVSGTVRADGDITGTTGEEDIVLPIPDLAGMDYENTADYDVADLFSGATYTYDNAGGNAWQMPETSPAHIFRKNPSDRSSNTSTTAKDDYFLEDPYEQVNADYSQNGSDPYAFTLSGVGSEPGPDSNQKVFYIDGNLWLHNRRTYSLGLSHDSPDGVQVTFVVKGNIYFADNLFYEDDALDGLAFIAMEDPGEPDSGNIYFGDPVFGTLQQMHAFMYAENDFNDVTRLHVDFDDRISTGDLEMPGLPDNAGLGVDRYVVVYWHRLARPDA
jgi:hypothetical protein